MPGIILRVSQTLPKVINKQPSEISNVMPIYRLRTPSLKKLSNLAKSCN